jgi:hypothetical protein
MASRTGPSLPKLEIVGRRVAIRGEKYVHEYASQSSCDCVDFDWNHQFRINRKLTDS